MVFYKCDICKRVQPVFDENAPVPECCGQPMKPLKANTTDGAKEKHVPEVSVNGNKITAKIGSVDHPMLPEHYITMVVLETKKDFKIKELNPGEAPCAEFELSAGEEAVAVYEYCNLHGLWKAEI
ncbi:MAG: desulfoferrodoxin [Lachnospiraceae bacterium]|nr:desulfoferrodoxin [Lachnospiraceae bacterium]